jgi:hypothetical protein
LSPFESKTITDAAEGFNPGALDPGGVGVGLPYPRRGQQKCGDGKPSPYGGAVINGCGAGQWLTWGAAAELPPSWQIPTAVAPLPHSKAQAGIQCFRPHDPLPDCRRCARAIARFEGLSRQG